MRYEIITYNPQTHIQICHLIGVTKTNIEMSEIADDVYYGKFIIIANNELFSNISSILDVDIKQI